MPSSIRAVDELTPKRQQLPARSLSALYSNVPLSQCYPLFLSDVLIVTVIARATDYLPLEWAILVRLQSNRR